MSKAVCRKYVTGEMVRCPAPAKKYRMDPSLQPQLPCNYGHGIVGHRTIVEICYNPDSHADRSHEVKCPGCGALVRVEQKDA